MSLDVGVTTLRESLTVLEEGLKGKEWVGLKHFSRTPLSLFSDYTDEHLNWLLTEPVNIYVHNKDV